jgi:hypothetical protein
MKKTAGKAVKNALRGMSALALSLTVMLGTSVDARADEADAKKMLKAMSDYLAAQKAISFKYDATLEVVTKDEQKLALVSSGTVTLNRPDKIRAVRAGGFADVETSFDGKTLTLLGKNLNMYAQQDIPGTIDHLIDELRTTYHRYLPAANLLLSNSYDALMRDVVDVRTLAVASSTALSAITWLFEKRKLIGRSGSHKGNVPILVGIASPRRTLPANLNTSFRSGIGKLEMRLQPLISASRTEPRRKRSS